jgi:hypothetical protein
VYRVQGTYICGRTAEPEKSDKSNSQRYRKTTPVRGGQTTADPRAKKSGDFCCTGDVQITKSWLGTRLRRVAAARMLGTGSRRWALGALGTVVGNAPGRANQVEAVRAKSGLAQPTSSATTHHPSKQGARVGSCGQANPCRVRRYLRTPKCTGTLKGLKGSVLNLVTSTKVPL